MGNTQVHDTTGETPRRESKVATLEPIQRTANSKVITVIVDDQIQFEVDITDPQGDLTCGWLLAEVTRKYSIMLEAIQKNQMRGQDKNKKKQDVRPPRQKRRYIVALKTKENREGVDSWLNQYERDLSALRDGTVLLAHFAKLSGMPGQSLLQKKDISIDDFEQMRVVGRGGFSKVILARKKDTGRLYAIKILRKDQLVNENQIKPILSERKVLEQLDHPFLIKLHWAFQSHNELFFVMDICTGGELFCHLLLQRRFSERLAKFYMSEILLGFQYMHERDIVYRDIKPENILVDMDGHIRIADFGLSKVIGKNERSYSFCGSPEYLSPEMLQNTDGHDRRLDIYCLGVLLYEMLTGLPPFYDENHQTMFESIMYQDLQLNQSFLSREVKHLLAGMLEKEPSMRYQSISDVMNHPWFSDVDWKAVLNKTQKPSLQPDINQCYFENDNGDEDDESDFVSYTRVTVHGNQAKSNLRRHSYYIHSTVQLQSCIDDRTSFMRSPSQLRQFFDSSTLLTKLDESMILQNLHTSVLQKSMILQKQPSIKGEENFLSASQNEIPKVEGGPFVLASESFVDFDYAHPPLAEIQILRVLENHINRKKKDQLDKARRFREQLLQRRQDAKAFQRGCEDSLDVQLRIASKASSTNTMDRKSIEEALKLLPDQALTSKKETYRLGNGKDRQAHGSQSRSKNFTKSGFFQQTSSTHGDDQVLGLKKEISEPPIHVFSDSEIYDSRKSKVKEWEQVKKKSSMNLVIAEEYYLQEGGIGLRVDHYIPAEPQEELREVVTPTKQLSNNRAKSKPHSISSFHTEPEYLPCPSNPKKSGTAASKTEYTPIFFDERNAKKRESCSSVSHSDDDDFDEIDDNVSDSIGTESKQYIDTQDGSSDIQSVTQKPLMSQNTNTISIKKLRTNDTKSGSKSGSTAEYGYQINQFDSMQSKSKGVRNLPTGLLKVNHQSLKSPPINVDSMLLPMSSFSQGFGGQQTPKNHTKVSSMVILQAKQSHENPATGKFDAMQAGALLAPKRSEETKVAASKNQNMLQQQEATFYYSKIRQNSPARQYQKQIKKLSTQSQSLKITDQQHLMHSSSVLTPTTVVAGKKQSLINFSEEIVDDSSYFYQNQEESKSVQKLGIRLQSKQAAPTILTESDATVENFAAYGSNQMSTETRGSHLSPTKQASSNPLDTVKESVPRRFNQSMKEKSGQGSSGYGPASISKPLTKNSNVAGKTPVQSRLGPQSQMKKIELGKPQSSHSTTILARNQSPSNQKTTSKKEIPTKQATQTSLGSSAKSGAIKKVEPRQLKSLNRITASPQKLIQNRKQINQKDFSLKNISTHKLASKSVKDRPKPAKEAEDDSIENPDVADETEESRPSMNSIANASLGQIVRKSDVGLPSKIPKDYTPSQNVGSGKDLVMPLKQLLFSTRDVKKSSVSPDPAVKRSMLDFSSVASAATRGQIVHRHTNIISPRTNATAFSNAAPFQMLSAGKFYKPEKQEDLSPRRTVQTKLVSASLDVESFKIGLNSSSGQRNNSIGKLQKTLNSSNTSLRKIENQIKQQSAKVIKSGLKNASSFVISPTATKLAGTSKSKIDRKKSSAQMQTVPHKVPTAGLQEAAVKTTTVQLSLAKQRSGDMLKNSKNSTIFKLEKLPQQLVVPSSSHNVAAAVQSLSMNSFTKKSKGTVTPANGTKRPSLTKQESSRSLTNTCKRPKLQHNSVVFSTGAMSSSKQRKQSVGSLTKHRKIDSSRNALPLIQLRSMENSNSPKILQQPIQVEPASPLKIELKHMNPFQSVTKTEKDSNLHQHLTINKLSSNESSSRLGSNSKNGNRFLQIPGQMTESSRNAGSSSHTKLSSNLVLPSSQSSIYQDNVSHRSPRMSSGILISHGNGTLQHQQLSPKILPEASSSGKSYNFQNVQSDFNRRMETNDISGGGVRGSVSHRGDSKLLSKSQNAVNSAAPANQAQSMTVSKPTRGQKP